jgi:hypothetical protein
METFRRKFREWGAKQPTVVVTMWPDSPTYAEQAGFGTVCTDVYPFFSAGNPNGPNTPAASRAWYQRHVGITAQAALKSGQTPWIMPQSHCEVWGPWAYTADGDMKVLPGGLVHWRAPAPAEIRWEIWSALAAGTRGFFFYLYDPEPADKPDAKPYEGPAFPAGFAVKEAVVLASSGAFVRPDGKSTPQYEAMAEAYAAVAKLVPLLTGAVPATGTLGELTGPGILGTLYNPRSQRTFGILVNSDPDQAQALRVWLVKPQDVRDLRTGQVLPRAADNTVTVTVGPGDGTVLEYVE